MITHTNQLHVVLGTGPLAVSVMRDLLKRGHAVRMVNRSGRRGEIPPEVEVVAADLYQAEAVREVTNGAVSVYQCAQPEYTEWAQKFPALQRAIVEGVAANGAKLIVAENLYMYGEVTDRPMTEDLPNAARTRKGRIRAQMSEALLAAHKAGKLRVAIARASDFFGPGALEQSPFGDRVVYSAMAGKAMQTLGPLDVPHTFTYIGDFGRTLAELGCREDALGQIWHVPNDRPTITSRELGTLFAEAIGGPAKFSPATKPMMILAGLFVPPIREMWEMVYEFEKPFVVDSKKAESKLGLKPTPIREAVAETVAWFKTHPKTNAKH